MPNVIKPGYWTKTRRVYKGALDVDKLIADTISSGVDLSAYALKTNVLEIDNTTSFTPSSDYHPATKKYVDDGISAIDHSTYALKSNVLELDNTDAFTPTQDYHPLTLKYFNDNSGGAGDVIKVGTPVNEQVAYWTGDGTLAGHTYLNFDISARTLGVGINNSNTGGLALYGGSSNAGGAMLIYNGASGDTDDDYYSFGANSGIFTMKGGTFNKFLEYTSSTKNLDLGADTLQLSNYGAGTITGTATQGLAVDVSGNILEVPLSPTVVTSRVTPDHTISNQGSYQTANNLSLAFEASTSYALEAYISITTPVSAGASVRFSSTDHPNTGLEGIVDVASNEVNVTLTSVTSPISITGDNTQNAMKISGFIKTTNAGTLTLQFSQASSDAGNTTLHENSWVKLTKI